MLTKHATIQYPYKVTLEHQATVRVCCIRGILLGINLQFCLLPSREGHLRVAHLLLIPVVAIGHSKNAIA